MTVAEAALAATAGSSIPRISDKEFALLQGLIHREAGIYLSEVKQALVVGRLARRLRELGLTSFGAYYRLLVEGDESERVRMLDCICTNETHFFREPRQFEFMEQHVFPGWTTAAASGQRPERIRAWSAACSTGEEPYSLAMTLLSHFPPASGWDLDILATDLSTRALDQARSGLWRMAKVKEIPQTYLKAFMLRGTGVQEGVMKAGPEIASLVRFERQNLNQAHYPPGPFDLIFCRNVLIYFDAASKVQVVNRLLDQLAPQGHLFLGHAESLAGLTSRTRSVGPTVYVHASNPGPEGRQHGSRASGPS